MPEPALLLHQYHGDFDEFCQSVRHWDLDYRQLESGSFSSELVMLGAPHIIFSRAKLGRRMLQRGSPPPGLVTFGLLADPLSHIYWRNQDIGGDDLFIFPPGGELHSITQSDFDVFVISLTEQRLNAVCEGWELPAFNELVRGHESFRCDSASIGALRSELLQMYLAITVADENTSSYLIERLNEVYARELIRLIASSAAQGSRRRPRRRDTALAVAEEYIATSRDKVLTMEQLCSECNVSERTLEYAFQERYGMTPKAFTQVYRLNEVRKALRNAEPIRGKVTTVAQNHGFSHMGQFSVQYRKLFGESPSATLHSARQQ